MNTLPRNTWHHYRTWVSLPIFARYGAYLGVTTPLYPAVEILGVTTSTWRYMKRNSWTAIGIPIEHPRIN